MNIRKRITAVAAMLAVLCAGLLVTGAPAQASPSGCAILNPWAVYPASWTPNIILTNNFLATDCGLGRTVTDIDVTRVLSSGGVPQCVYARVELYDSSGHSLGTWTTLGAWTWQLICDQDTPHPLVENVRIGQKWNIQVTAPLGSSTVIPIYLQYVLY